MNMIENNLDNGIAPVRFWRHDRFATVLLIASLLLIWEIGASQSTPERIPSLLSVGAALYSIAIGATEYAFFSQVSATLLRLVISVILSLLIGVPLGILMGRNSVTESFASVPVLVSMSIPAFVWAFLGVLWFGRTEYIVTVMVGIIVLAPIVVFNVWQGTKEIDSNLLEMSQVFQLSTRSTWRHVFFPHLTPYILSSTRMIVAVGWKIMLVAEIFGADNGLGFVINEYFLLLRNDMILAWSLPMVCLIFVFDRLLRRVEIKLFDWKSDLDNHIAA